MLKVNLSSYDNSWYSPGGKMKSIIWYFVNLIFFKSSFFILSKFKIQILRLFGSEIGKGVVIKPNVNIKYPWKLKIGNYCWIGENVWIDNLDQVTIGDNVCISQGAMLLCGNHNYKKTTFDLIVGEIALKEGAWLGAKATVCPGVTLNSHAILSVGSVANKDLDAYAIYQGNPALKIRERNIE